MAKDQPVPPAPLALNHSWLFVLGREPLLSAAEITAVFSWRKIPYEIESLSDSNLVLKTDADISAFELIDRLGGTIKIAKKIDITVDGIAYFLNHYLPQGKINFSLNGFARTDGVAIKKQLRAMGRGARYIEPKNTATVAFNNLIKKGADLTKLNDQIFISQALQPFEEFSRRDYGRPGRDNRSGLLPPKLAMIMINLASMPFEATLLDPFCGSGTIITEALWLGYKKLIGADVSEQAVSDTKNNIDWLKKEFPLKSLNAEPNIFQSDVRNLEKTIKNNSVEAIVTEPYLGKPLQGGETLEEIKSQAKELKKLYLSAFQQFKKILKLNGAVVFIIPCFKLRKDWIKIDCLSEIKKLGFEPVPLWENKNFLLYSRPDQRVGREIWKFVKK